MKKQEDIVTISGCCIHFTVLYVVDYVGNKHFHLLNFNAAYTIVVTDQEMHQLWNKF
jgi:hypothetical protein